MIETLSTFLCSTEGTLIDYGPLAGALTLVVAVVSFFVLICGPVYSLYLIDRVFIWFLVNWFIQRQWEILSR